MAGRRKRKITKGRDLDKWHNSRAKAPDGFVRVIGGRFRGKTLRFSGDPVTRPMKDNVREALFNLVGGYLENTIVFDLFAGTGVVGMEALSRGARFSFLIERHVPTVKIVRENVDQLGVESDTSIHGSDTFFWVRQFLREHADGRSPSDRMDPGMLNELPWAVFCCPPYNLFVEQADSVMQMIGDLADRAPNQSLFVVESDSRFDPDLLPDPGSWDLRTYSPAVLAVKRLQR